MVADRYADGPVPEAGLTVTAPADGTVVSAASTVVTGTAPRRATVDVTVTPTGLGGETTRSTVVVGRAGGFAVEVPLSFGANAITVTATARDGSTGHERRTVTSDLIQGTTVLDVHDPAGDDYGHGTFAYPLAADFKDGAFDLTGFQVVLDGDTVYLVADVRDLSPTFGDPLGAQLLTVFIADPDAAQTSTAPFYASRNYTVAAQDAWSRALQVRGFAAPRLIDPDFAPAGEVSVQGNAATGQITVVTSTDAMGGVPGPGWPFTLALWGQDGFGIDEARPITTTPQDYTFGVCAAGGADPRCVLDPVDAPFVMDTIPPPGVEQEVILDALLGPVQLRGVTIG